MPGRAEGGAVERYRQHPANSDNAPYAIASKTSRKRKIYAQGHDIGRIEALERASRAPADGTRLPPTTVAGYIVDFACPEKKLVVEVDGSQHAEPDAAESDDARTLRLEQDGWAVLRFWNDDVVRDVDNVCQHIVIAAGLGDASSTYQLKGP